MGEDRFEGISRNLIGRLRPGAIEAAIDHDYDVFKASHLDSNHRNTRIGFNMSAAAQAGLIEVGEASLGRNYRKTESLEPAKEAAEDAFRYRIIEDLAALPEHSEEIVKDLEGFKIYENIDGTGLIHFHGDEGYHQATVWMLEDLGLIEDDVRRGFTADPADFSYVVDNVDDWHEIADALGDGEILPEEYIEHMHEYELRFPPESYDTGPVWVEDDLDRLR